MLLRGWPRLPDVQWSFRGRVTDRNPGNRYKPNGSRAQRSQPRVRAMLFYQVLLWPKELRQGRAFSNVCFNGRLEGTRYPEVFVSYALHWHGTFFCLLNVTKKNMTSFDIAWSSWKDAVREHHAPELTIRIPVIISL